MSFQDLNSFLNDCVVKKRIPGCVCWVGNKHKTFFFEKYGYAQIVPQAAPMRKDAIFDLASLTKPVATALSIMLLQERGLLELDDCIDNALPSLKKSAIARKTTKQLLIHTSGLPAWYPTYMFPEEKRLKHIADLTKREGKVVYSCLGYILLGRIIEQITQINLADFFQENITKNLGLKTLGFGPVMVRDSVAATEHGNLHELDLASQYSDVSGIKWRKYLIQGEVHDGNAYYGFNNVAGIAGLFSNTQDLASFIQAYLNEKIVSRNTLKMMIKDHTGGEDKRGLGWRIDPYPGLLSPASFGHTGFTGTMLVVDPRRDLIIILLANAVHPRVKLGIMNPIRQEAIRIISETMRAK